MAGHPLVDRAAERARIGAVLDTARAGRGATLIVRGDPGSGKTALLAGVRDTAGDLQVLAGRGVAAEQGLALAALGDLLAPIDDLRDDLSAGQRTALEGALGLGGAAIDPFATCTATLALLAAAAARGPVVLLVDDGDLVDEPSAAALAFALRRLGDDGVAAVITCRSATGLAALVEADRLELAPLSDAGAGEVVRAHWPDAAPFVAARIGAAAGGLPGAAIEIADGLGADVLAGRAPLPDELPLAGSLDTLLRARLSAAGPDARRAALLAALADGEPGDAVRRACAIAGVPPTAVDEAAAAGLVTRAGERVVPASASMARVLVDEAGDEARELHRALAGAYDEPDVAHLRAWHLGAAATTADETLAGQLADAATTAARRSGGRAAERLFVRAAALSVDDAARAGRLAAAARAAIHAGRPAAAEHYLRDARAIAPEAERAELDATRGRLLARSGRATRAAELLTEAAPGLPDPAGALAEAALALLRAGQPRAALDRAREALAAAGDDAAAAVVPGLMLAVALAFTGDLPQAAARIAAVDAAPERDARIGSVGFLRAYLGAGLAWSGSPARAESVLERLADDARERAPGVLPYTLVRLAGIRLDDGRWASARALLEEAALLAGQLGLVPDRGLALGALAWLDAAQGRDDDVRAHAGEAETIAVELGAGSLFDRGAVAPPLAALGAGRAEEAVPALAALIRTQAERGWSDAAVTPYIAPELCEALVRCGRAAEAQAAAAAFADDAARTERAAPQAVALRARALVAGEEGGADELLQEALALHAADPMPFEEARTRLAHGELLRRRTQRVASRERLRDALDVFTRLGAEPWIARCEAELRSSGETVRRGDAAALDELTPQELQVAGLVAGGATNKEVAAKLFLSPKTVEFHLGRIYKKLGVRSRTQLSLALGDVTGS